MATKKIQIIENHQKCRDFFLFNTYFPPQLLPILLALREIDSLESPFMSPFYHFQHLLAWQRVPGYFPIVILFSSHSNNILNLMATKIKTTFLSFTHSQTWPYIYVLDNRIASKNGFDLIKYLSSFRLKEISFQWISISFPFLLQVGWKTDIKL